MQGIILAGGFGTRLRPLTVNYPKPMIPLAGRPIMEHCVELLKRHGITDIISVLYFQPEIITNYFGDGSRFGVRMQYVTARDDLGTAGSTNLCRPLINGPVMILSGDVLTDFDLTSAIEFHDENKAKASMLLTRVENPLAFGVVIIDEKSRIVRFLEKPSWGEVFSDTVNTGTYILEPEVFDLIPPETEFDFSKNLYPLMLEKKDPLYGYVAEGYWRDLGTHEAYAAAVQDILHGRVQINIPFEKKRHHGVDLWMGRNTTVAEGFKPSGSVMLGNNVTVGPNVTISDSMVEDNSILGASSVINRSSLWYGVEIGAGANLSEAVVASASIIHDRAVLREGTVVSENCSVGASAVVKAGVKVWPHKFVEPHSVVSSSLIWGSRWAQQVFGSHGVSGLANRELTPEFACRLGAAFGASIGKGGIVLSSRDAHKASRVINRALISGILSAGVHVQDMRTMPIPVVRFNVRSLTDMGGFHVRKSPYNPQFLDVKFFDGDGLDLSVKKEKSIEGLYYREDFYRAGDDDTGELTFSDRALDNYSSAFLTRINTAPVREKKFKIVLDYANDASTTIFPAILGGVGCEVVALNSYSDATKLTRTDREWRQLREGLSRTVVGLDADAGFLIEPGAERIRIVDNEGHVLSNQEAVALMAYLALHGAKKKETRRLGIPVTASRVIERMCQKCGAEAVRTKTNHRAMTELVSSGDEDTRPCFLGALDGGFIFSDFMPFFDSMFSIVKCLELLSGVDKPISELIGSEIPKPMVQVQDVRCSWEMKGTIMRNLIEYTQNKGKVELVDGVKVWDGEDWVLLLPDPDRPSFRIYAESDDPDKARALIKEYYELIWEWHR